MSKNKEELCRNFVITSRAVKHIASTLAGAAKTSSKKRVTSLKRLYLNWRNTMYTEWVHQGQVRSLIMPLSFFLSRWKFASWKMYDEHWTEGEE